MMVQSRVRQVWVLVAVLAGCSGGTEKEGGEDRAPVDLDGDGVVEDEDCDDESVSLGAIAEDADCDGFLTAEDCDDNDASLGQIALDGDCDGVFEWSDCDDADPLLGSVEDDADCDGDPAATDCDDGDPTLDSFDRDWDGISLCDGDCDDEDAATYPGAPEGLVAADRNCDGSQGDRSLARAHLRVEAAGEEPMVGVSSGLAGDLDGDGLADLLFDVYGPVGSGMAMQWAVVLGSSVGSDDVLDVELADYQFWGPTAESGRDVIRSVGYVGDVDGDGGSDLLVVRSGVARLFLAHEVLASSESSSPVSSYELPDVWNGTLAGLGDVNGDGRPEFAVGFASGGAGLFDDRVLSDDAVGTSADAHWRIGGGADGTARVVGSLGDLDGDGLSDLIVVDPSWSPPESYYGGAAYIVLGDATVEESVATPEDADLFIGGTEDRTFLGNSAAPGDVDGDGLPELVLCHRPAGNVPGYPSDTTGRAFLFNGSSMRGASTLSADDVDILFTGVEMNSRMGEEVAAVGDLDADGLGDLLVAAEELDTSAEDAGGAYVVLGASLPSDGSVNMRSASHVVLGEAYYDRAGSGATAGDVDGDGRDDLVLDSYASTTNASRPTRDGKAYFIFSEL